jgi:hypothetical protein
LDTILREVDAPKNFELLSIDVDSDDLEIWRGLHAFRPLCVVIEYNPTIPFDVRFSNPLGRNWGNAPLSICDHAEESGYRLVAVTRTNLVLLDERTARDTAQIEGVRLDQVTPQMRIFWGFDGTLIRVTPSAHPQVDPAPEFLSIPWARGVIAPQPVPKVFRRYVDESGPFSSFRRWTMLACALLARPIAALQEGSRARKLFTR